MAEENVLGLNSDAHTLSRHLRPRMRTSVETHMVTRQAWWKSIFEKARDTVNAAKTLIEEEVVHPVAEKTGTFTGQAVLEEVRAYMAENEVINSALVTCLKESESENAALKTRLTKMESRVHSLTILGLVLAVLVGGLTLVAVLHWILR
jgi:hypothetical protein